VKTLRSIAWATLLLTLAVILWGAFVRASGSGAGCGSHWPLCNGEVVPRPKSIKTVIELTHRATSGLALILTVVQLVFALRTRHSPVRRAAIASMFFMVTEAGVGAGLVLFEMVAGNKSVARALWMSAHLINTFFLLAALALTVYFAYEKPVPRVRGPRATAVVALAVGILAVSVAGAVVALGDTLFPARSLAEGLTADVMPGAHFLIRLRAIHPLLAVFVGVAVSAVARSIAVGAPREVRRWATLLVGLFVVQMTIGVVNLLLLAPIAVQLVHLLVADLYWMAAVIFGATALAAQEQPLGEGEHVDGPVDPRPGMMRG
jgi:heme a synthase